MKLDYEHLMADEVGDKNIHAFAVLSGEPKAQVVAQRLGCSEITTTDIGWTK